MKKYLFVILVLGLFITWPLLGARFIPTHDGEYHIIRFANFYKMLSSGYLFPRWAPDLNSTYGLPLFNFHYPFPNYVGSLFHVLGVSFVDAVKLTLAAGYFAAAVFSYAWLRTLFSPKAAAMGTIAGMFVPYWFVDMYVRGSVGEVLAIPFVFLSLWAVERKIIWLLGVATALLIISHNIMAMLFVPVILLYLLLRWRLGIVAWIFGILSSSYFWLPAILERGYMTGLNPVSYRDHFPELVQLLFPSWGTGFSGPGIVPGEMSFQIGLLPLLLVVLARPKTMLAKMFLICFIAVALLMLPLTRPLWETVSMLQFLQYPWRLLSFVIPASAFLMASLSQRRYGLSMLLVVLGFVLIQPYVRPVTYEKRGDEYYLSRKNFTDGTSSLGNSFTTIWTPWKSERPSVRVEVVEGDGVVRMESEKPLVYHFGVSSTQETKLLLNVLFYPGWTAYIDGQNSPVTQSDGVLALSVPEGQHDVTVRFEETSQRWAADMLSLVGLFCLLGWAILKTNAYRDRHDTPDKRPRGSRHRRIHEISS